MKSLIDRLLISYCRQTPAFDILVEEVIRSSLESEHRFDPGSLLGELPTFDDNFEEEEQLPVNFKVEFRQDASGKSCMFWDGCQIGDSLTDSILLPDEYRFHDVFHFGNAAVLHWSPVLRSLTGRKRKSDPVVDEVQDGGRARVVEEGLSAWVFSCAKKSNFFENQDFLPDHMQKTIEEFTAGYEVEQCPFSLWERAILESYRVFREIRKHGGGIVSGNRHTRTIDFLPLR